MLAPDAKPADGLFDLVLIHANQRESFFKFIRSVLTGSLESLPEVSIRKGRNLEIAWRGFPLHLDGEVIPRLDWTEENEDVSQMHEPELLDVSKPYLSVEMMPRTIHFLVPKVTTVIEKGESDSD